MAKKEKQEKIEELKGTGINDIFKEVDKLNPDASFLNDSTLSVVSDYIDTGSYALNAIISGSFFKGAPQGRILGFSGPSSSGKSLFVKQILANAQKKGYTAVIWDTENAIDSMGSESLGLDPTRTKYYPVETVEQCRNQIATFLDRIIEANKAIDEYNAKQKALQKEGKESKPLKEHLKVIIAIDSLGNLASTKELNDIAKGGESADMGTRAKALKSMMRALTVKTARARVPMVVTNHIYDNPGEMHPSLVKQQSGGKGLIYLASILVQLSMRTEKIADNEEEESLAVAHNVSGVTLGAMTIKNRFVPPFLKTELYLNFKTGLSRYAGLFDMGKAFGVIELDGKRYKLNMSSGQSKMLGFKDDWINDVKVWEEIVPHLNAKVEKELCYGSVNEVVKQAEALVGELENESQEDEDEDGDETPPTTSS
jgi:RecA/RadA recombinase